MSEKTNCYTPDILRLESVILLQQTPKMCIKISVKVSVEVKTKIRYSHYIHHAHQEPEDLQQDIPVL